VPRMLVKLSFILVMCVLLLQTDPLINTLTTSQVEIGAFDTRLGTLVKLFFLLLSLLVLSLLILI
jgi:hypothetical protein